MIDEETTKKRFKQTNFYCLRCGAPDIVKKDNIKYFAERQNFHPRGKSASVNDVETTFFVTASLYCVRCKHTYFVKILEIKFYHYKYQRLDTTNKGALLGLKWSFQRR